VSEELSGKATAGEFPFFCLSFSCSTESKCSCCWLDCPC